jgi:hypothetical protein
MDVSRRYRLPSLALRIEVDRAIRPRYIHRLPILPILSHGPAAAFPAKTPSCPSATAAKKGIELLQYCRSCLSATLFPILCFTRNDGHCSIHDVAFTAAGNPRKPRRLLPDPPAPSALESRRRKYCSTPPSSSRTGAAGNMYRSDRCSCCLARTRGAKLQHVNLLRRV